MAGAITRSAPESSTRVLERSRVRPARKAMATNDSAAGQRVPPFTSTATTTPSSPASSRASFTGTTSVTPPS